MFDTPAQENPYPTNQASMVIRPRPLILFLGGIIGVLISIPAVVFIVMLITDPQELFKDFDWTSSFFIVMPFAAVWLTYRWFTIQGRFNQEEVCFRGLFRTLKFKASEFGGIRKIYYESYSEHGGTQKSWKYIAIDKDQNTLGSLPGSMQFCKDWPGFHKEINKLPKL